MENLLQYSNEELRRKINDIERIIDNREKLLPKREIAKLRNEFTKILEEPFECLAKVKLHFYEQDWKIDVDNMAEVTGYTETITTEIARRERELCVIKKKLEALATKHKIDFDKIW